MARENSNVVARENSNVVARENSSARAHSPNCTVELFGFAVAFLLAKGAKVIRKAKTATIIRPKVETGVEGWLNRHGIEVRAGFAVLFKRVSREFKTQEKSPNETTWTPGATLEVPGWNPTGSECGAGKFHAVGRPYFGDEFRDARGDRYVAIKVAVQDLHTWESASYPHKIAFRAGTVLFECNRFGKEFSAAPVAA